MEAHNTSILYMMIINHIKLAVCREITLRAIWVKLNLMINFRKIVMSYNFPKLTSHMLSINYLLHLITIIPSIPQCLPSKALAKLILIPI